MNQAKSKPNKKKLDIKLKSRQCISCRNEFPRDTLIRITKVKKSGGAEIVINPDKYQHGRSIYICKIYECLKRVIKEKKIFKVLKISSKLAEDITEKLETFDVLPGKREVLV